MEGSQQTNSVNSLFCPTRARRRIDCNRDFFVCPTYGLMMRNKRFKQFGPVHQSRRGHLASDPGRLSTHGRTLRAVPRTTTQSSRSCSTFSRVSSICAVANGSYAAGWNLRVRPSRAAHAFRIPFSAWPHAPDHRATRTFDELRDLIAEGGKPDPEALAKLRAKYDTVQIATLTPGRSRRRLLLRITGRAA